jgi:hypothetical protein
VSLVNDYEFATRLAKSTKWSRSINSPCTGINSSRSNRRRLHDLRYRIDAKPRSSSRVHRSPCRAAASSQTDMTNAQGIRRTEPQTFVMGRAGFAPYFATNRLTPTADSTSIHGPLIRITKPNRSVPPAAVNAKAEVRAGDDGRGLGLNGLGPKPDARHEDLPRMNGISIRRMCRACNLLPSDCGRSKPQPRVNGQCRASHGT